MASGLTKTGPCALDVSPVSSEEPASGRAPEETGETSAAVRLPDEQPAATRLVATTIVTIIICRGVETLISNCSLCSTQPCIVEIDGLKRPAARAKVMADSNPDIRELADDRSCTGVEVVPSCVRRSDVVGEVLLQEPSLVRIADGSRAVLIHTRQELTLRATTGGAIGHRRRIDREMNIPACPAAGRRTRVARSKFSEAVLANAVVWK